MKLRHFTQCKLQKIEKYKAGNSDSDDLPVLLKTSAENGNNGPVIGQKRPISNNDELNNVPENVLCCKYLAKTVPVVGVDVIILDQTDQEHQILKNLGDAILEKLASVVEKNLSYKL